MERSDIPSPVSAARTLRRTEFDLTRSLASPTLAVTDLAASGEELTSSRPETASATLPVRPAFASRAAATETRYALSDRAAHQA